MTITIDKNPDITLTTNEIRELLKRPDNLLIDAGSDLGKLLFDVWSIGPVVLTRDSTVLEQSNYDELIKMLKSRTDLNGLWQVIHITSSLQGWVKHLAFEVLDYRTELRNVHSNLEAARKAYDAKMAVAPDGLSVEILKSNVIQCELARDNARDLYGELGDFPNYSLSIAAKVIIAWQRILAEVHVANEDDANDREQEACREEITRLASPVVMHFTSKPMPWEQHVLDWLFDHDNGALNDAGKNITLQRLLPAIAELGLMNPDVAAVFFRLQLTMLYVLKQWGMQTVGSMKCEIERIPGEFAVNYVEGAFFHLCRQGLVHRIMLDQTDNARRQIETRSPGTFVGDVYILW